MIAYSCKFRCYDASAGTANEL